MATATDQAPASFTALVPVAGGAAGSDLDTIVCVAPFAGTLSSASFIADTTLTGANTESRTLSVINKGQAGAGTTNMATKAFVSTVNAAAFDETALTLSVVANALDVVAGDVLVWNSLHIGATGLADPGGSVKVVLSRA
jgi:hypothetical protein